MVDVAAWVFAVDLGGGVHNHGLEGGVVARENDIDAMGFGHIEAEVTSNLAFVPLSNISYIRESMIGCLLCGGGG